MLRVAARDPVPAVRVQALHSLGELKDREGVAAVVTGLADKEPAVRHAALLASGKLGDLSTLPPVLRCMRDADEKVQGAAAATLHQLQGEGALEVRSRRSTQPIVHIPRLLCALNVHIRALHTPDCPSPQSATQPHQALIEIGMPSPSEFVQVLHANFLPLPLPLHLHLRRYCTPTSHTYQHAVMPAHSA